MNINLFQDAAPGIYKPVRRAGLHDEDVAGPGISSLLANNKPRVPLLHYDNLIVLVAVQWCASTRLGFNEEHRYRHVPLIGADKIVRTPNQRQ